MKILLASCVAVFCIGGCRSSRSGFGDMADPSNDFAHAADLAGTALIDMSRPLTESSTTTEELLGVWGASASDVYVVGRGGTILHSAGDGQWSPETSGTSEDLNGIWGSGANDIYVAGAQHVLHSIGDGTWTMQNTPSPGNLAVWGSSANDLYAGGLFALAHSTGDGAWTAIPASESEAGYFHISGRGPNDVWAVGGNANGLGMGSGGYEHFDGTWTWVPVTTQLNMKSVVFTTSATFMVGNGGLLYVDHGSGFMQETSSTPNDLNAIWAATDGTMFAVGGSGTALTSVGDGTWTGLSTPSALPLNAVWGSSAMDVYAVGMAGEIVHLR